MIKYKTMKILQNI